MSDSNGSLELTNMLIYMSNLHDGAAITKEMMLPFFKRICMVLLSINIHALQEWQLNGKGYATEVQRKIDFFIRQFEITRGIKE